MSAGSYNNVDDALRSGKVSTWAAEDGFGIDALEDRTDPSESTWRNAAIIN